MKKFLRMALLAAALILGALLIEDLVKGWRPDRDDAY